LLRGPREVALRDLRRLRAQRQERLGECGSASDMIKRWQVEFESQKVTGGELDGPTGPPARNEQAQPDAVGSTWIETEDGAEGSTVLPTLCPAARDDGSGG
jgi:hypothetical protein